MTVKDIQTAHHHDRKKTDFKKSCRTPFDAYSQVYNIRNITNTMKERTKGAICLIPTGKLQGRYHFLSLRTRRKITHGKFTEVPTTSVVVKRVTNMVIAEIQEEGIIFKNRNLVEIDDLLPDIEANDAYCEHAKNDAGVGVHAVGPPTNKESNASSYAMLNNQFADL